jgi:hypothetical protein
MSLEVDAVRITVFNVICFDTLESVSKPCAASDGEMMAVFHDYNVRHRYM